MKESIYTIPISEVFEPKQGCPLCALAVILEERWVQYITGAAMMEPDVRVRTNEEGFCARHLTAMLGQRNRLSVALILQTRLQYLLDHAGETPEGAGGLFAKKKSAPVEASCFVCDRVERELARLADNIVTVLGREESFRALYREQEFLCAPHYSALAAASVKLRGQLGREFLADTAVLLRRGLEPAKADIDAFCKLFDYHSAGGEQPPQQVATAVETAAERLSGYRFPV
jgi:hypothetical protein